MAKKFSNIPLPNNIILKDYTILKRISSGGFSFVYLGMNNYTKEIVAIKEYMPNSITIRNKGMDVYITNKKDKIRFELGLEQFFNEMSIISHINHHNIIQILDYFEANNTAYIVTPYEYGMPLDSYIQSLIRYNKRFTESKMLKIIIGILEAIQELHNHNVLHLDLKPPNIWLRPNYEVLILDFGAALEKNKVRTKQHFFTNGFAAIEQYKEYHKPLDMGEWTDYYGIGATIFHMLTFKTPTDSVTLKENNSRLNIYEQHNGLVHYKILEIVNLLCHPDPAVRKKIDLGKVIEEVKHIVPFNYNPEDYSIEKILMNN